MANFEPILLEKFSAKDIKIVCRICLLHKQILYSIFDHDIDKLLLAVVRFPITKNDGYPHQICSKCYKDVVTAYRFKKQCEYAHNIVKSILKPTSDICCNRCPTTFSTNSNLKRHLRNIHGIIWDIGTPLPDVSNSVQNSQLVNFTKEHNAGESRNKYSKDVCKNSELDETLFVEEMDVKENLNNAIPNNKSSFLKSKTNDDNNFTPPHTDLETAKNKTSNFFYPIKKPTLKELIYSKIDKNSFNIEMLSYLDLMPGDKRIEYENLLEQKKIERKIAYKILKKINGRAAKSLFSKKKIVSKFDENEKFECFECKKSFEKAESFRRHQLTHSDDPKPYACGICSKLFSQSDYLNFHLKNFHVNVQVDRPFQCFICKKLHICALDLSDHISICGVEKKIFSNHSLFQIKIIPKKEEQENDCKINYTDETVIPGNPNEFNINQINNGFSRFKYQYCNEEGYYGSAAHCNEKSNISQENNFDSDFSNENSNQSLEKAKSIEFLKNLLSEHPVDSELVTRKIQSIKRNINGKFECELCQKDFNRKSHVRRHYLTHTTAKPYACEFCSGRFSCAEYLQTHMNRLHLNKIFQTADQNEVKIEPTESSNLQFFTEHEAAIKKRRVLKNDVLRTTEGKFQCKICQKLFTRADHVRRHELIHSNSPKPFKCKYCRKEFSRPDNLKKHLDTCSVRRTFVKLNFEPPILMYNDSAYGRRE